MRQCPQCSSVIKPGSRYCSICGFNLTDSNLEQTRKSMPIKSHKMRNGTMLDDRFLILNEIARGGMGLVFRAKDTVLDEIVALKILKADLKDDDEMVTRFKREIKIARKIKHPNVCSIYDFGFVEDNFYISMEFLAGDDLSVVIEQRRLSDDQLVSIFRGLIGALRAAHQEDIIHRDLKPSNIMLDRNNRPIILDFGIARHVGKSDLTLKDDILGTPNYMSPEQFQGYGIDQRADIYSLGVIMYQLYTGCLPFTGDSPIAVAMKHLEEPPPSLRKKNPLIPSNIEKIILKCLQKDPDDRYQQVNDILIDLNPTETWKTHKKHIDSRDKVKILVADDDNNICTMLSLVFQERGFETVTASNGEEAVTKSIHENPSLILMDLLMPKMDGYQAAEYLLSNNDTAHIPIIMLSCRDDKQYRAYSKSIGVREYLTKPVDVYGLVGLIDGMLNPPSNAKNGEPVHV